ncbi:MAG TPA: Sir2 family NAD-dependent protein deacetylase [Sandaracinaceae bacterium LLY-WYZ-13_1]|nr:Sir2 family NAD-dependent protein deacetylase [Sandaracinaceae bacterium LLY-WYZ-13_1]
MSGLTEEQRRLVDDLARRLRAARDPMALTGAGVSTESGIPDFRSAESGIWREHDPMEVASLEGFRREPRRFYTFWEPRFGKLGEARPNAAHRVLAALERAGMLSGVVTQNIDGLHGVAGSERVLEVHGSYRQARCLRCGRVESLEAVTERVRQGRLPICEDCGELMKPDVVLFGEQLPPVFAEATRLARQTDLLVVLGSSLGVHPVAGLVPEAHEAGAAVVLINREPSPYDEMADVVIHGELGPVSRALAERLGFELAD